MAENIIYIASDHAGYTAKEEIKQILTKLKYNFKDLGPKTDKKPVDYPDYAKKVSEQIIKNKNSIGILICGSGTGMQIAANKIKGIRAAFAYDTYSAQMAKQDNNANILTLRARQFNHKKYTNIIKIFIKTQFSELPRHKKRISKLEKL